mmetsp:Transcript_15272/g.58072  ORF Transcript_15272/g.58072 Transcript_15272/m.58072 type:complete len:399 (-) Transcript_15272:5381-6577(-)
MPQYKRACSAATKSAILLRSDPVPARSTLQPDYAIALLHQQHLVSLSPLLDFRFRGGLGGAPGAHDGHPEGTAFPALCASRTPTPNKLEQRNEDCCRNENVQHKKNYVVMLFGNAILVILRRGSLRHIRKEDPTDGALRDDGDQAVCRDAERPHGEVDHQEDHGREKLRNRREVTSTVEACRQDGDREASGALDELEVKVRSLIGLGQEGRLSDMMFHLLRDLREVLRPRAPALPCRPEGPIAPQATQRHAVPKLDKESRPEEAALRTLALSRLAPVLVVVRCGLQQVRHGIRQQVTLIFAGPGHRVSAMVLARGNLEVAPESSHPHKNLRNRELQRRLGWPKQQPRVEQRNADRIGKDHDSCVHDEAVVHGSSATKRIVCHEIRLLFAFDLRLDRLT